tara:strand:+ start:860 stop:1717 length:858 start_codon:yes stop_codon:yes gene_type:complete
MINILCTSKPGDGLFCYSYEHCHYLNSVGIPSQVVVITHPRFNQSDYLNLVKEKYITCENIVFDDCNPSTKDVTVVMGRSMITLPYLSRHDYTSNQMLTLHLLTKSKLISVYSENHPGTYDEALHFFKADRVYDLCDFDVYPNGKGDQFEKMINFSIYKPIKEDIKYEHLFLGTNAVYYEEIKNHIYDELDYAILSYNEKYIDKNLNHVFAPVKNLLGMFKNYVYTKPYFDPAPRLIQEFKWLGKNVTYLRNSKIKDGGLVYIKRPVPTEEMYRKNINMLIEKIM